MPPTRRKSSAKGTSRPAAPVAAALAEQYLRRFAGCLASPARLREKLEEISAAVAGDRYLESRLVVGDPGKTPLPTFDEGESVLAVADDREVSGYLGVSGRRDGRPLSADDLHLMGALASFVSAMMASAARFEQSLERQRLMQFLLDQVPVGVVCTNGDLDALVANRTATELVESGRSAARRKGSPWAVFNTLAGGAESFHFESGERLVFAEKRVFNQPGEPPVVAYVLTDLTPRRTRLAERLLLEGYRAGREGRGGSAVALRSRAAGAGGVLAALSRADPVREAGLEELHPVDAYTCVALFPGLDRCELRVRLRGAVAAFGWDDLSAAVVAVAPGAGSTADGDALLDALVGELTPGRSAFNPRIGVLEAYRPVYEMIQLMLEERFQLDYLSCLEALVSRVVAGDFEGVVLDVDSFDRSLLVEALVRMREAAPQLRCIYTTYRQPEMVRAAFGFKSARPVVQKPFDADRLRAGFEAAFDL